MKRIALVLIVAAPLIAVPAVETASAQKARAAEYCTTAKSGIYAYRSFRYAEVAKARLDVSWCADYYRITRVGSAYVSSWRYNISYLGPGWAWRNRKVYSKVLSGNEIYYWSKPELSYCINVYVYATCKTYWRPVLQLVITPTGRYRTGAYTEYRFGFKWPTRAYHRR